MQDRSAAIVRALNGQSGHYKHYILVHDDIDGSHIVRVISLRGHKYCLDHAGLSGVDVFGDLETAKSSLTTKDECVEVVEKYERLLGLIQIGDFMYVCGVKDSKIVGTIGPHSIRLVTSTTWVRVPLSGETTSEARVIDRKRQRQARNSEALPTQPQSISNLVACMRKEIDDIFELLSFDPSGLCYYCDTQDLTRRFPSANKAWDCIPRYSWNEYLALPFAELDLRHLCAVLLLGSVKTLSLPTLDRTTVLIAINRLSTDFSIANCISRDSMPRGQIHQKAQQLSKEYRAKSYLTNVCYGSVDIIIIGNNVFKSQTFDYLVPPQALLIEVAKNENILDVYNDYIREMTGAEDAILQQNLSAMSKLSNAICNSLIQDDMINYKDENMKTSAYFNDKMCEVNLALNSMIVHSFPNLRKDNAVFLYAEGIEDLEDHLHLDLSMSPIENADVNKSYRQVLWKRFLECFQSKHFNKNMRLENMKTANNALLSFAWTEGEIDSNLNIATAQEQTSYPIFVIQTEEGYVRLLRYVEASFSSVLSTNEEIIDKLEQFICRWFLKVLIFNNKTAFSYWQTNFNTSQLAKLFENTFSKPFVQKVLGKKKYKEMSFNVFSITRALGLDPKGLLPMRLAKFNDNIVECDKIRCRLNCIATDTAVKSPSRFQPWFKDVMQLPPMQNKYVIRTTYVFQRSCPIAITLKYREINNMTCPSSLFVTGGITLGLQTPLLEETMLPVPLMGSKMRFDLDIDVEDFKYGRTKYPSHNIGCISSMCVYFIFNSAEGKKTIPAISVEAVQPIKIHSILRSKQTRSILLGIKQLETGVLACVRGAERTKEMDTTEAMELYVKKLMPYSGSKTFLPKNFIQNELLERYWDRKNKRFPSRSGISKELRRKPVHLNQKQFDLFKHKALVKLDEKGESYDDTITLGAALYLEKAKIQIGLSHEIASVIIRYLIPTLGGYYRIAPYNMIFPIRLSMKRSAKCKRCDGPLTNKQCTGHIIEFNLRDVEGICEKCMRIENSIADIQFTCSEASHNSSYQGKDITMIEGVVEDDYRSVLRDILSTNVVLPTYIHFNNLVEQRDQLDDSNLLAHKYCTLLVNPVVTTWASFDFSKLLSDNTLVQEEHTVAHIYLTFFHPIVLGSLRMLVDGVVEMMLEAYDQQTDSFIELSSFTAKDDVEIPINNPTPVSVLVLSVDVKEGGLFPGFAHMSSITLAGTLCHKTITSKQADTTQKPFYVAKQPDISTRCVWPGNVISYEMCFRAQQRCHSVVFDYTQIQAPAQAEVSELFELYGSQLLPKTVKLYFYNPPKIAKLKEKTIADDSLSLLDASNTRIARIVLPAPSFTPGRGYDTVLEYQLAVEGMELSRITVEFEDTHLPQFVGVVGQLLPRVELM